MVLCCWDSFEKRRLDRYEHEICPGCRQSIGEDSTFKVMGGEILCSGCGRVVGRYFLIR